MVAVDSVRRPLKAHARFLWYRACVVFTILAAVAGIPFAIKAALSAHEVAFVLTVLAEAVAFSAIALFVLNLAAFPWNYSIFGRFARTSVSAAGQRICTLRSGIVVGHHFRATWPGVVWSFGPEGIGIEIELIGAAFIAYSQVRDVFQEPSGWFTLEHSCPEIRSPIRVPPSVFSELQKQMHDRRQQHV